MTTTLEIPATERWEQRSTVLAEPLELALARPLGPPAPAPLVVVLDPVAMLLTAVEVSRTMTALSGGALPPLTVLGVSATGSFPEVMSKRFRDFTAVEAPIPDDVPPPFPVVHGTGGSRRFLDALVTDVLPAARARADVTEVTVAGWSLSGLFAVWAWCEAPEVVTKALAVSPSLWWAEADQLGRDVPAAVPGRRAYLAVGEHEEGDAAATWPPGMAPPRETADRIAMVGNVRRWTDAARAAGLDVLGEVLPGEHHITTPPAALSRGLRFLHAR